jgi:iron-sulfur cluster repair protein YtfE (RIC family)
MERPADTTVYRLVQRAMVTCAQRLADTSGRADHDAGALARWTSGFAAELRWHQADEDAVAFPALLERVPAAASIVERLTADHRELDGLLDQLEAALADAASPAELAPVAGRCTISWAPTPSTRTSTSPRRSPP